MPSVPLDGFSAFAVGLALTYSFFNGFRDAATIAATVVSTRVLTPAVAFALCSVAAFGGALLLGGAVAATISKTILVEGASFTIHDFNKMVCIGIAVALAWGLICWWRGWPTSNAHALIAGLVGAAMAIWGPESVRIRSILRVLVVLIASPLIGFVLAIAVTALLRWAGEHVSSKARFWAGGCHIASSMSVAAAHGSNDAQLVAGVLLPLTAVAGTPPSSVRLLIGFALAAGVLVGGQRLLKKLSLKFYRIRDPQGLGAELTAATTIFTLGSIGFPASPTQTVLGSIVGAGVAQNPRRVRWDFVQEMTLSWVITFPAVSLVAFLIGETLKTGGW
jgi:PiT family inorganic phosphate transporter